MGLSPTSPWCGPSTRGTSHSSHFPRECPRGTFWAGPRTTADDVERFLAGQPALRVHAVEAGWLDRMRAAHLYAYRMSSDTFTEHPDIRGYWVSREPVEPLERLEVGDLLERHVMAGIELRLLPNLWPLWDRVVASSLEFSGIRLRNAQAREPVR
jgi:hypothetical protein